MVKQMLIAKEKSAFEVKTIKKKMVEQVSYWNYSEEVDQDWCEILGWYADNSSGIKTWNMILFKYSKNRKERLYKCDKESFFSCCGYKEKEPMEKEFAKLSQLFLD